MENNSSRVIRSSSSSSDPGATPSASSSASLARNRANARTACCNVAASPKTRSSSFARRHRRVHVGELERCESRALRVRDPPRSAPGDRVEVVLLLHERPERGAFLRDEPPSLLRVLEPRFVVARAEFGRALGARALVHFKIGLDRERHDDRDARGEESDRRTRRRRRRRMTARARARRRRAGSVPPRRVDAPRRTTRCPARGDSAAAFQRQLP
eukprot:31366-Pelagococcus_subviridis.AAC.18